MTRVIVDRVTRDMLLNAHKPLELCDDAGIVLGHFIPVHELSQCAEIGPQVDAEELDRREQQGGGRPLRDILVELGKNA